MDSIIVGFVHTVTQLTMAISQTLSERIHSPATQAAWLDNKLDDLMKQIMDMMDLVMALRSNNSEILNHFQQQQTGAASSMKVEVPSANPWFLDQPMNPENHESLFHKALGLNKEGDDTDGDSMSNNEI